MRYNEIFLTTTIFMLCELFFVKGGDLPPEIQKCKPKDNGACIAKAVEDILQRYPTGNSDFGLPNVSALNVKNLKISRASPTSPIQINFEFINCTVFGLEDVKVVRTAGFDTELKNAEMDTLVPNLRMRGNYEMMGKLLLLPLNGKGVGEIELVEAKFFTKAKMEKFKRNNKTHLKVKKIRAVIEPKQMNVKFENVVNGNAVLSATINEVINENWMDVWTEMHEGINHVVGTIIENVSNEIFDVLSLEEMYLD